VSSHAKGDMHNADSGPPVGMRRGRGWCRRAFARARAWRRVGCGCRSVPAQQLWPPFFLIHPSAWEADWQRRPLPFSRRWVPPAPVRSWGSAEQTRPPGPWKARCMRFSREFIGTSSPAARVEGARRSFQSLCKATSVLRPPGSSCGPPTAVHHEGSRHPGGCRGEGRARPTFVNIRGKPSLVGASRP
jgi:hypothetical protein